MTRAAVVCLFLTMISTGGNAAPTSESFDLPSLCMQAARDAAQKTGVPLRVLTALMLTETGRSLDGDLKPWPWTLNAAGEGFWFETRDDALHHLEMAVADGKTNIDVGCFQLNYRWHHNGFESMADMVDPSLNATYAANLIATLHKGSEDWIVAAGTYHSGTAEVADRYLARFMPIYAALDDSSITISSAEEQTTIENTFPLIVRGRSGTAGSLVPLTSARIPLIGGF